MQFIVLYQVVQDIFRENNNQALLHVFLRGRDWSHGIWMKKSLFLPSFFCGAKVSDSAGIQFQF